MRGLLTFFTIFALYCAARGGVVDLDNSNFDQVMLVTWILVHSSFCSM